MGKINRDIAAKYSTYESLLNQRKYTADKTIVIDAVKPNRSDVLYSDTFIQTTQSNTEVRLIIESKLAQSKDFKFKLRCEDLSKEPFFRFDSSGAAHKNQLPNVPLTEQQITTPHFNAFDKDGRSIAYKTSNLIDSNEAKALEDITFCFAHFCFESNIRFPEEEYSDIEAKLAGEIKFDSTDDGPLSNVKFEK